MILKKYIKQLPLLQIVTHSKAMKTFINNFAAFNNVLYY